MIMKVSLLNYGSTIQELYIASAKAVIQERADAGLWSNLKLLSHVQSAKQVPNLPSWVPDCSLASGHTRSTHEWLNEDDNGSFGGRSTPNNLLHSRMVPIDIVLDIGIPTDSFHGSDEGKLVSGGVNIAWQSSVTRQSLRDRGRTGSCSLGDRRPTAQARSETSPEPILTPTRSL